MGNPYSTHFTSMILPYELEAFESHSLSRALALYLQMVQHPGTQLEVVPREKSVNFICVKVTQANR